MKEHITPCFDSISGQLVALSPFEVAAGYLILIWISVLICVGYYKQYNIYRVLYYSIVYTL